jgi:RNA polymerase sigma factor (sigma-70 family)
MGIPSGEKVDLGLLMERAQAGDEAAYLQLLAHISPIIRGLVRRKILASRHADMEDIVQDVLVSVHVVRATYDPSRPFLPWLMSIVHHRIVDKFRRSARISANEQNVGELLETFPADPANSHAEAYGDDELLRREIEALPASQRRAIELLKLKEMTLKEAARESGMTVANLKVLVHRAMKTLRKRIVAGHDN